MIVAAIVVVARTSLIVKPLLPHFSRPLTDNDRRAWKPQIKMKQWYEPGLKLQSISTEMSVPGIIKVISNYTLIDNKASLQLIYTINGDGVVRVDYKLNPHKELPNIPVGATIYLVWVPWESFTTPTMFRLLWPSHDLNVIPVDESRIAEVIKRAKETGGFVFVCHNKMGRTVLAYPRREATAPRPSSL